MKGYWTEDYYVGIFPDGHKKYYATEQDYKEEWKEFFDQDENE